MVELSVPYEVDREVAAREAFATFADEFGYKIIVSRESFPDYRLKRSDGKKLTAEMEYKLSSVYDHIDDDGWDELDLVICWECDTPTVPKPILELRQFIDDQSQQTTSIAAAAHPQGPDVNDKVIYTKTLEIEMLTGDEARSALPNNYEMKEPTYRLRIGYYKSAIHGGDLAYERRGIEGALTEKQLQAILNDIDSGIVRKMFVDEPREAYETFEDWHQGLSKSKRVQSYKKGRFLGTAEPVKDNAEFVTLRLGPDYSNLQYRRYMQSHFDQKTARQAMLPEAVFASLLLQLPYEIRESVFINCNFEPLWEYTTSQFGHIPR